MSRLRVLHTGSETQLPGGAGVVCAGADAATSSAGISATT
jgi:hypothetical protein